MVHVKPDTETARPPGLDARRLAWSAAVGVLRGRAAIEDVLARLAARAPLEARDAALARAIATVLFRRFGTIRRALAERLARGWPKDERLALLLAVGAAQILFLDVPDHAAVDVAVRLAADDRALRPFTGLANAVLRRIARERDAILAGSDALRDDTPGWLAARWTAGFGAATARAVAEAHRRGAALDLTVKEDPRPWAERLGGAVLPTGSVRLPRRQPAGAGAAGLRRGRVVGAGRRRGAAGAPARRRRPASVSPTCAPPRAARRRSSRLPARRCSPSTARSGASSACAPT